MIRCQCLPGFTSQLLTVVAIAGMTAQSAFAQRVNRVPDQIRSIQTVEPLSGPVGTMVRIHTENLPIQARIHVGVGARHVGFEALVEVQQEEWGEVTAELAIPEYWTWDRPLVLIIFNGLFSPIGLSAPFHVTDGDGMIQRTGRISDEGGSCPGFRDQDDYFYALDLDSLETPSEGDPMLRPGAPVIVEGTLSESDTCAAEVTIHVVSVEGSFE